MIRRNFLKKSSYTLGTTALVSAMVSTKGYAADSTPPPSCTWTSPALGGDSYTEYKQVIYERWVPANNGKGEHVNIPGTETISPESNAKDMEAWTPTLPVGTKGGGDCPMKFSTPPKTLISQKETSWAIADGSVPGNLGSKPPTGYVYSGDETVKWTRTVTWKAQANVECAAK